MGDIDGTEPDQTLVILSFDNSCLVVWCLQINVKLAVCVHISVGHEKSGLLLIDCGGNLFNSLKNHPNINRLN